VVTAPTSSPAVLTAGVAADLVELRRLVDAVPDPELPVLTLGQLGVIRSVRSAERRSAASASASTSIAAAEVAIVEITPTYSGCPAMEVIAADVAAAVSGAGWEPDVRLVLAPAWTTDWITAEGRIALREAGIAPPARRVGGPVVVELGRRPDQAQTGLSADRASARPTCPLCGSAAVEELARFGSTACKALWRCLTCREPFDYVKPL
jgi:ring-1,2-phenylacetyl-CoA epoxidase subunit PaaD